MVLVFIFIFCFASGPGTSARPEHAHKCTFTTSDLLIVPLSRSDGSDCRGIIHPAVQGGRLHHRLHHQLAGPVHAGDGLSYHSGEAAASGSFANEAASRGAQTLLFSLQKHLHAFCFLIFLFFCTGCLLFIKFNVPEIKNLTALQIAAEFQKMHTKVTEVKDEKLNGIETHETKL